MDLSIISKKQEDKLREMCSDLFPESEHYQFIKVAQRQTDKEDISIAFFDENMKLISRFTWFQLCMLEIPKRLAVNSSELEENVADKQWFYYEIMSKRMLALHPIYKDKLTHPVDYLYEEYQKI